MSAPMPVWHLRWTYDGHLAGCGIFCDGAGDVSATREHLRVLAAAAAAGTETTRVCPECLDLAQSGPRAAVTVAFTAALAFVLFVTLLGCGLRAATHRDLPDAQPAATVDGRAETLEVVR